MSKQTKNNKLVPQFKASVQPDGVLEMLVYDQIGESWDGSGVTGKDIKSQLDGMKGYNRVAVRINSPGGDAFEGVAIGSLLKSCGKPVDVYIDGIAASAASVIAMAGDTITMENNAIIMIHNAYTFCLGNADDMRKEAEILDTVSQAIAQTYVDRTGQTMKDVQAMMDAETWLTATDAVAKGFATSVAEQSTGKAGNALAKSFKAALKTFKNVPAELKADDDSENGVCECTCETCTEGPCSECMNPDCEDPGCEDCPMQADEPAPVEDKLKDSACECLCENCKVSDCSNCSNAACNVEDCMDCPMQESRKEPADSNVSQYEARLALLKLTSR